MVKKFSKEELRKFNGESGAPIYVAYKKKVYDVTKSTLWKNGIHVMAHKAGVDLTEKLLNAPHGEVVFKRYPDVGALVNPDDVFKETFDEKHKTSKLLGFISTEGIDRRVHRMVSHFPISLLMTASLLILLYKYFGERSFELAAYYTLSLGIMASPVSVLSGYWSWKKTYLGIMTKIFKRKIIVSIPLLIIGFTCVILRSSYSNIMIEKPLLSWIYFILVLSLTPMVITLGYYGGKITFMRAF